MTTVPVYVQQGDPRRTHLFRCRVFLPLGGAPRVSCRPAARGSVALLQLMTVVIESGTASIAAPEVESACAKPVYWFDMKSSHCIKVR